MKKILQVLMALSLTVFSISSVCAQQNTRIGSLGNNTVQSDPNFELDFESDLTYYTFIYDHTNQWEVDDVIGQSGCIDGYLYTKNFNTGVIRQLINVKVNCFFEVNDRVYFPYDNSIYCVDYLGTQLTEIYSANGMIGENVVQVKDDDIYFILDNVLVKYNVDEGTLNELFSADGMTDLYIRSDNEFVYLIDKEMHYVIFNDAINNNANELNSVSLNRNYNDVVVDDVQVMNYLLSEEIDIEENDASINSSTVTYQKDYNLTQIMASYPSGSYFTQDGTACYHHGSGSCSYYGGCNCKNYDYAIQCMGFAKYASDRYAHKSSWNPPSAEQYEPNTRFNSVNQIKTYFDRMTTGAYVLLSHSDNETGFHAMFYVKSDSNGVTTYECNINGHCDVATYYTTYEGYKTRFNTCYGIYTVSHNYSSTATSYNANFHKYNCTTCGGYILEYHYGSTLGNGTCMKCGYSGNIQYNYPMTMGDY